MKALSVVATVERRRRADELQAGVAHEGAGEETGLDQHLEAVADAEHVARRRSAKSTTARITGERAAMAPQRR